MPSDGVTPPTLGQWSEDVQAAKLTGLCTTGLERNLDVVTQGVTSHWNSGLAERRVKHVLKGNVREPGCPCSVNESCSAPRSGNLPGDPVSSTKCGPDLRSR